MNNQVTTYETLWNLVDLDAEENDIKEMAILFLNAMQDWPTFNQTLISDFILEFKAYFGIPITLNGLNSKQFNGKNAWQLESAGSIIDLIDKSTRSFNESDLDKILKKIFDHYNRVFQDRDFTLDS